MRNKRKRPTKDRPPGTVPSETGRIRLARRARTTDDLISPISAILHYSQSLLRSLPKAKRDALEEDLGKILGAALSFRSLLEKEFERAAAEDVTLEERLSQLERQSRHDLRTPLNHIIGYSEMLLEEAEDAAEGAPPELAKLLDCGRRLLAGFDNLTGAGGPSAATPPVGRDTVIERLVRTVRPLGEDDAFQRDRRHGHVLIADDNDINRDLLSQQLTRAGHTVREATNGREAFQMLEAEPFDVVLLDVIMPEMNGIEALHRIRADERLRHVPVIMLSALDELDSVTRCIEIGAEDYIQKPFEWALLRARIEAALEKKRLRDREVRYLDQIEAERTRSDRLLRVILPDAIIRELKSDDAVRPRRHEGVAVLFTDIVGFTSYCDHHDPEEVVGHLQNLVVAFEEAAANRGILKVKTIGDAFMAAAGVFTSCENPVLSCLEFAVDMVAKTPQVTGHWQIRTGIHYGPVVAGILGKRQFGFDIWGDTVNTAARVVDTAAPDRIALSRNAWERVAHLADGDAFTAELKGKGRMEIMMFRGFRR